MAEATWSPGRLVWYELYTPDVAKSKAFYEAVAGWKVTESDMGSMKYTMANVGEKPIAGFMPLSVIPMQGVPPFWMAYVSVPSVDEAAAGAKSHGGKVLMEPTDIPHVGRFAVLQDAQGAVISAFKGTDGDGAEVERPPVGTFCWSGLNTTDLDAAAAFYARVFGWTKGTFMGNAEMPVFLRGQVPAAGMMKAPPGVPPHWLNHILVADLAAARTKAVGLGAKVMMDNIAVPGIGTFCVITDNVGAAIALFQGTA
ncbi:MAG: VOC family protein [Deltaproteobacteria bacterium]|nr:VOC family protein [Deltaproteobacteria bacterium]